MKKTLSLSLAILLTLSIGLFSACQYEAPKNIIGAQLNDKGELILTYSDNTTQNLGVVKGEDGKNGVDGTAGEDLVACAHTYNDWETQLSPTCTSIGYDTRTCSLCSDVQYEFTKAIGHNYTNPVDIINTYEQHLVSKTCSVCGDTKLEEVDPTKHVFEGEWEIKEYPCATVKQRPCLYCDTKQTELIETIDFGSHTFDENTLCTTCGHQEFIESEEYMEETPTFTLGYGAPVPTTGTLWWNKDRTYGLILIADSYSASFKGYVGTPVHVQLPAYFNGVPFMRIDQPKGWSEEGTFKNCTTLKSVYIPDTVTRIESYAFDGCTNLESVRFSKNLTSIGGVAFRNCTSLKKLDFKNNNSGGLDFWHSFNNCTSLKEIYFPLQARTYNDSTYFENCALEKIYISEEYRSYYEETFYVSYPNLEIISYT